MKTESSTRDRPITAERVPEDGWKLEVLVRHFGPRMVAVEDNVAGCMRYLSTEYNGGLWGFFELSNGGFYMAPAENEGLQFHVRITTNGYEGQMSAEAAGITACLIAFSGLAHELRSAVMARHFFKLWDFAQEHPEAKEISAAIG